jgi:hypothetical protein
MSLYTIFPEKLMKNPEHYAFFAQYPGNVFSLSQRNRLPKMLTPAHSAAENQLKEYGFTSYPFLPSFLLWLPAQ